MRWSLRASGLVKELHSPKSFFLTNFTSHSLRSFSNCVQQALDLNQSILPIYSEGEGGSTSILNGMIGIIDAGRKNGLKFATIVNGCAMSANAFIYCYGDDKLRFMSEQAIIMLHKSQVSGIEGKLSDVKGLVDVMHDRESPFLEKISKHLGKRKDWLEKKLLSDKDWYINPQEALREGICSFIHSPSFILEAETKVAII